MLRARALIIEVTGFDAEDRSIVVNRTAPDGIDNGSPAKLYCAGVQRPDGVIALVDWGYLSRDEAFGAWPEAMGVVLTTCGSPPLTAD